MSSADLARLQEWFDAFTAAYRGRSTALDHAVELKRAHTRRVQQETEDLVSDLGLGGAGRLLPLAAALLHDVGRFEQFARWGTFDDGKSADHAELGCRLLTADRELGWLPPEAQAILFDAVLFHNRARLPVIADPLREATCRIVRDADKLDIWQMVAADYREHQAVPHTPFYRGLGREGGISPAVSGAVASAEPVSFAAVVKLNDYVVLQAAMAFDLNYAPSFRRLRDRRILDAIRSVLPADPQVDRMFEAIALHVAHKAAG